MPVKLLKAGQNGGLRPFKGQGQEIDFSNIKNAPTLTKPRRL